MKHESIIGCDCIEINGRIKTVLRTAEPVNYVTLTDKNGRSWGACSNFGEPFDFQTHIFYLPEGTLDEPLTANWIRRNGQKESISATLTPDMVTTTTVADFIRESDHHITVKDVENSMICDGVTYKILKCVNADGKPVRMFVLFVDPAKAYLATGTADDGFANHTKTQTVKGMAEAAITNGRKVVAATNADFFDVNTEFSPYMTAGLCIKDGRIISNSNSMLNFLGMDRDGKTVISNFVEEPWLQGQLLCAVGGREIFLRDGEIADISPCEPFSYLCHPRTCAGVMEDATTVLLVADGRLPDYSNGASLVDLAIMMQSFGVKKAINLDGGQSCNFIVKKNSDLVLLNRPANQFHPEIPGVRKVFNSILVVQK